MKSVLVAIVALFSFIYLLNPGFGWIEIINDNLPLIGNLDEATAMAALLACARYFGYDFSRFFGKQSEDEKGEIVEVE